MDPILLRAVCPDRRIGSRPRCAVGALPVVDPWEAEIAAFEAGDRAHPPVAGGVVFIGSSSIRKWETLGADVPDANALNRGS